MAVNIDLSNSDAWDDSALLKSWNEALKEYKKYHSIHVQGKKVSEVLSKEELAELSRNGVVMKGVESVSDDEHVKNEGEEDDGDDELGQNSHETVQQHEIHPSGNSKLGDMASTSADIQISVPDVLMSSVKDESVKNLMMAWYWAGYYTGYHEGEKAVTNGSSS